MACTLNSPIVPFSHPLIYPGPLSRTPFFFNPILQLSSFAFARHIIHPPSTNSIGSSFPSLPICPPHLPDLVPRFTFFSHQNPSPAAFVASTHHPPSSIVSSTLTSPTQFHLPVNPFTKMHPSLISSHHTPSPHLSMPAISHKLSQPRTRVDPRCRSISFHRCCSNCQVLQ